MENPKQTTYAPEELFTLKPQPIKTSDTKPVTQSFTGTNEIPSVVLPSLIDNSSYWDKYKWYMIGGVVIIGCVSLIIYIERKNNKKKGEKN